MGRILGIDLGTNSIGLAVRDTDKPGTIEKQLDFSSSVIFRSGVGTGKSGEYSYASLRTSFRSARRLHQSRRYRKWGTLKLLIEQGYCPLDMASLERWCKYDKTQEQHRQYPVDDKVFQSWIALDFNGDGSPDYSSPYQLRRELATKQLDFSITANRMKLGRALYHIAQRRGFKSSKGETLAEIKDSDLETDVSTELKKSEESWSKNIKEHMEEIGVHTVGEAFADLEDSGIRVRGIRYTAIRQQFLSEIEYIFTFQKGLGTDTEFYRRLVSTKKGEGTIFFRRPLRSQKGTVGKCTLEKGKTRCPVSHPDYEKFRALSLINNIKIKPLSDAEPEQLDKDLRTRMFDALFMRRKPAFKFEEIRKWLEKQLGYTLSYESKSINYKDYTSVSGCPVSAGLKGILGDDWEKVEIVSGKNAGGKEIKYDYIDLWHVCYSFDDEENVYDFGEKNLGLDEKKTKSLCTLWGSIQQGYSMLSLKAIRNINRFLAEGYIYTDAVLMAKIPEILGEENWNRQKAKILGAFDGILSSNQAEREVLSIVNSLISKYKGLSELDRFAEKNTGYVLQDSDIADVGEAAKEHYGEKKWNSFDAGRKKRILEGVTNNYQKFFGSGKREYFKIPKIGDAMKSYLKSEMGVDEAMADKLYHPSSIEFYPKVKATDSLRLLGDPDIGIFKNPVALRTLRLLREQINSMLKEGLIDEDTRIIVEMAREMNDANMRWAIETYQRAQEAERAKFAELIQEYYPGREIASEDIQKVKLFFEQEDTDGQEKAGKKKKAAFFETERKELLKKYALWREQSFRCIYTGQMISLTELFDGNKWDLEHTIPRSRSMDNSMANLTICSSEFNRKIKKNQIPSELSNYEEILSRIKPWTDKVEQLRRNIESCRARSRSATTKELKDSYIRQRHLWKMELDYWEAKVRTFEITADKVNDSFRSSQLIDTRIISKYALHYLRSAFDSVEVLPGRITAEFRKLIGIQAEEEKKERSLHSHHAVDAAVLTLIPNSAQRNAMLNLFYRRDELRNNGENYSHVERQLNEAKEQNRLEDAAGIRDYIENNLIVNHISKDQTLTPARRKFLVRDRRGNRIWRVTQGDSIRCSLHKESYYGAIKHGDEYRLVIRVPLDQTQTGSQEVFNKFIERIVDRDVASRIETVVKGRVAAGCPIKKALDEPIWLADEKGNEIKRDCNGRPLARIRHVRCRAVSGLGFLKKDTALEIKQHTYKSQKDYKQSYYAQNGDNYLCLMLEKEKKGKIVRDFRLINYFQLASVRKNFGYDIGDASIYQSLFCEEGERLKAVIKTGTRVLMWENDPEEIYESENYSNRLYVVYKFNNVGTNYVFLRHHSVSNTDQKEATAYSCITPPHRLRLTAANFKALTEGYDFTVDTLGRITLLHHPGANFK